MPKLSLVVATLGRTAELTPFLESLEAQTERDFEVIVVDQNRDDRLVPVLFGRPYPFVIKHLREGANPGCSRGRNVGAAVAVGDVVAFPDDDCWYPPTLFQRVLAAMDGLPADVVSGRAADETGRTINGRFLTAATWIDRSKVFETQIEWMLFFRRHAFEAVGGFDEDIGPGSPTPWQACEGADVLLRVIEAGFTARYDPTLFGHHAELDVETPDAAMRRKARGYARGMGYVMAKHRFAKSFAVHRICRPLARLVVNAAGFNMARTRYYANVFAGRVEGFRKQRR